MGVADHWTCRARFAGSTLVLVCILTARAIAQSGHAAPAPFLVEYSTVPMLRNAALVDAVVGAIERGTDWLSDKWTDDLFVRKSTGGFAARLGRWLAWDFFVEGYGATIAHEYGHVTRSEEAGHPARVFLGSFNHSFFRASGGPFTPMESLSVFGGGFEGANVLSKRVEDRIYARGKATPGDLTSLFMTTVGTQLYMQSTLSEDRLSSPDNFFNGGRPGLRGDPATYALSLTAARLSRRAFALGEASPFFADIQENGRSIRRGSVINLIDYGVMTGGVGLFRDYMWRGQRQVAVRWLTLVLVSLVPGLRYNLTPVGPERQVRTRYKTGAGVGLGYLRWTEPLAPGSARLLGAGGEYQRDTIGGFEPRFGFDFWRNPDGTTSLRGEAATMFSRSSTDRMVLSFAVGAKGRGYLSGYPLRSGPYVNVGAGLRF